MQSSKFVKLDVDVLLEWIYDDSNYIAEDYCIIVDTLSKTRSFSQAEKTGLLNSTTNNLTSRQLFAVDTTINKWGIVDNNPVTNRYYFLQFQKYSGNIPYRYDRVRLHFPANYTFNDKLGFMVNIGMIDNTQSKFFNISNYYYDKTDSKRALEVELGTAFQFEERIWSKYIELLLPAPYALLKDYQLVNNSVTKPKQGSIHKNLVDEDSNVLSMESPIFVDFSFLTKKQTILTQTSYLTTEPFSITLPVTPEYETLAVKIEHASDGDYFNIYGTFNGTVSDFNAFIKNAALRGKRYHIIYDIAIFEKNMQTQQVSIMQNEDFDDMTIFRPVIKYSTTTASIDVTMKVVDINDSSIIIRKSSYAMLQDEAAKYAKKLSKINIADSIKPKIYNSKPDSINLVAQSIGSKVEKIKVPYAVMYERYNIMTKDKSEQVNSTQWYGQGLNQILLHNSRTDNFVKFVIGKGVTQDGVVPFAIPENTPVYLLFQSNSKYVKVPLFFEEGTVDLANGSVVFRIEQAQMPSIAEIKKDGFDQFYIIIEPENGSSSVIYFGKFLISNMI
jgi:hypothetical protein